MEEKTLRFTGRLATGEELLPVEFDVISGDDFRLRIRLLSPSVDLAMRLHSAMGEPGAAGATLKLEGSGDSGEIFLSDSVDIVGIRTGSDGCEISISTRYAKISRPSKESSLFPAARLWFRGFKSMLVPTVKSELGMVEVRGGVKRVGRDDASGYVAIHAGEATDPTEWFQRADKLLTFLHQGLAFASGKRIQTPALEVRCGDRWECTYFEGDGFSGSLAPIHYMNQGPFVEALVQRFERDEPFNDALWTVVGWLHIDMPFHEARFLMAMTALETLCEHVVPKSQTTLMEKSKYRPIRDKLVSLVADSGFTEVETIVLTNRIKQANGLPLAQKLCALRDHYQLTSGVFTDEGFADLCRLRNALVHSGGRKGQDVWPKIVFVRELLSHVVFREVGYTGPYERYLNGYASMPGAVEKYEDGKSEAPVSQAGD